MTEAVDQMTVKYGDRSYRVRGLSKNTTLERLKVNLLVRRQEALHVDVLDLYAARARAAFIKAASSELDVDDEVIKRDLGKLLLKLEQVVEERIAESMKPKTAPEPTMSPAQHDAALELLRDPHLLDRVAADLEACGLVGERTNALTVYLAATSRLLGDPLSVVIQSSSAAGKTTIQDAVLRFMPPEQSFKFTSLSSQALYYMTGLSLAHKVVALAEDEGARRAAYPLKILVSEKQLLLATPSKDEHGRTITTHHTVEGPIALLFTTTSTDLDPELMNRALVATVNEDSAQTRRIHKRQRARYTLNGLQQQIERDHIVASHRNVQRLLRPLRVVIPFAEQLSFVADRTRTRRDHQKYLGLISAVALLHQHQRRVRTTKVGNEEVEFIEATAADVDVANALMTELLGSTLDDLAPQTRRLLLGVDELVERRAVERDIRRSRVRLTRREIREHVGFTYDQLRLHLRRLVDADYLVLERGQPGRPHTYRLVHEPQGALELDLKTPAIVDPGTRVGSPETARDANGAGTLDPNPGTVVDHARDGANGSAE